MCNLQCIIYNVQFTMYNEGIACGDVCGGTKLAITVALLSHHSNLLCKFADLCSNGCGGARFAITVTLLSHHSNLLRKFTSPYGDDFRLLSSSITF